MKTASENNGHVRAGCRIANVCMWVEGGEEAAWGGRGKKKTTSERVPLLSSASASQAPCSTFCPCLFPDVSLNDPVLWTLLTGVVHQHQSPINQNPDPINPFISRGLSLMERKVSGKVTKLMLFPWGALCIVNVDPFLCVA